MEDEVVALDRAVPGLDTAALSRVLSPSECDDALAAISPTSSTSHGLPVHLVLLELLLHPIVSLVFQADPPDDDVMRRPPRPSSHALAPTALWRSGAVGVTLAVGVV